MLRWREDRDPQTIVAARGALDQAEHLLPDPASSPNWISTVFAMLTLDLGVVGLWGDPGSAPGADRLLGRIEQELDRLPDLPPSSSRGWPLSGRGRPAATPGACCTRCGRCFR